MELLSCVCLAHIRFREMDQRHRVECHKMNRQRLSRYWAEKKVSTGRISGDVPIHAYSTAERAGISWCL